MHAIQSYRTRVVTVQAVQWTGGNITAVQVLIAPASPLWVEGEKNVGIKVEPQGRNSYGLQHELQFAEIDDWIVRYPSGRVAITKAAIFDEYYEPVERAVPATELEVGRVLGDAVIDAAGDTPFPLGGKIEATHPRALADRQPETDNAGRVSER